MTLKRKIIKILEKTGSFEPTHITAQKILEEVGLVRFMDVARKIYCKNCKWCKSPNDRREILCCHPDNIDIKKNEFGEGIGYYKVLSIKDPIGDCQNYQCKWWKFWV